MLKNAQATLKKIGRIRHFDHLSAIALTTLDAVDVWVVGGGEEPAILGRANRASEPVRTLLEASVAVPVWKPVECSPHLRIAGEPMAVPHQHRRVVKIRLAQDPQVDCLIFPKLVGAKAGNLQNFAATANRLLAEHGLLQRYRADLRRYIAMFNQMERTAHVGVWEQRADSDSLFMSDEICRIFERPIGSEPALAEALDHFPEPSRSEVADALEETRLTGIPCDLVVPLKPVADTQKVVRLIACVQRPPEGGERLAGILQDVTQQHAANEELWWMANHDALTRLPNRALFNDRVQKALQRRERTGKLVCLLLIDVNRFKEVNDTLGHAAGDELLRRIANALNEMVRSNDTVARTGGDEFSILIEDLDTMDALERVFERLRRALRVELVWGETTTIVSLSAGAALAPNHGHEQDELTSLADLALYQMKKDRAGELALYKPAFGQAVVARNEQLAQAKDALAAGSFVPHYQPQVDLATGAIVGVEALARWVRPDSVMKAGEFAFALDDHELGPKIGDAILIQAINDLAAINAGRQEKLSLALNASAGEIWREGFLDRLLAHRERVGASETPMVVELSEKALLEDMTGELARRMKTAREEGVEFAVDDFGTGYASLVHVATLPVAALKIDRPFIQGLDHNANDRRIVKGIVSVARSLELRLTAEGVETAEQARAFAVLGGAFAQGYLYSDALPIDALRARLRGPVSVPRACVNRAAWTVAVCAANASERHGELV